MYVLQNRFFFYLDITNLHLTKHLTAVIIILFGRGGRVVKIKMFNYMFQKHWYIIFTTNDFFQISKRG